LNNYILSKIIFLFLLLVGTSPAKHTVVPLCVLRNTPTSFVATGEARLRREAKRLHLGFNLINYLTCKTKLVLFSTNFILALSRSVPTAATLTKSACGVRREKVDNSI
ncbi:hypothetical protein R4Q14_12755, partial [Brachyspira intermedia]|uniref:hypothetical protein n=1 Tax=Brachyspira intermedia TaxID=84377 RepID=UPI0030075A60